VVMATVALTSIDLELSGVHQASVGVPGTEH